MSYSYPLADAEGVDVDTGVTTNVEVTDESTFKQTITLPIAGETYVFNAEYKWDGVTFSSTITFEGCTETWNAPAG